MRRGVRLNPGDLRVAEEQIDQGADEPSSKPLPKKLGVGDGLVDAAHSRVCLVLPPSIAGTERHVGLGIGERPAAEQADVGRHPLRCQDSRQVALLDLLNRGPLSTPPHHDMRAIQLLVEHRKIVLRHRAQGDGCLDQIHGVNIRAC